MDQTTLVSPGIPVSSCSEEDARLRFAILAPAETSDTLSRTRVNHGLHSQLLFKMQSMRGRVYREYDQIAAQLTADGRHLDSLDVHSWHVLVQNGSGQVLGCSRYRPVNPVFRELSVSRSALACSKRFGSRLKMIVETDLAQASQRNVRYGEAGMWALAPELRHSTAAVNLALMTFALAEHLGGGCGITTATTRHGSASILQRLGGRRDKHLPAYYEPKYGCMIEVLFFSIDALECRHAARLNKLRAQLQQMEIILRRPPQDDDIATSDLSQTTSLLRLSESLSKLSRRTGRVSEDNLESGRTAMQPVSVD